MGDHSSKNDNYSLELDRKVPDDFYVLCDIVKYLPIVFIHRGR